MDWRNTFQARDIKVKKDDEERRGAKDFDKKSENM